MNFLGFYILLEDKIIKQRKEENEGFDFIELFSHRSFFKGTIHAYSSLFFNFLKVRYNFFFFFFFFLTWSEVQY
jgi:hypothetical protein